ncbi:MAG: hypothetical protein WC954_04265 [Sphaerochaeta sp.]
MRHLCFVSLILTLCLPLSSAVDVILTSESLNQRLRLGLTSKAFVGELTFDLGSEEIFTAISLGPFRLGQTRLVLKNTRLVALRSASFVETRLETSSGIFSFFHSDGGTIGVGGERGAFKALIINLPRVQSSTIFLSPQNQGVSGYLHYKQGPIILTLTGSEYTPITLGVSATATVGSVTVLSIVDSSSYPYRLSVTLGEKDIGTNAEVSLGPEPLYSGKSQPLRYRHHSWAMKSIGIYRLSVDYRLTLTTNAALIQRREVDLRLSAQRASVRVTLGWKERSGWYGELTTPVGNVQVGLGVFAYEFTHRFEWGEIILGLSKKGAVTVIYRRIFTIDQRG